MPIIGKHHLRDASNNIEPVADGCRIVLNLDGILTFKFIREFGVPPVTAVLLGIYNFCFLLTTTNYYLANIANLYSLLHEIGLMFTTQILFPQSL